MTQTALAGLEAWLVTAIPRPPADGQGDSDRDAGLVQRRAALTSAYHAGGPVAFGWARTVAGGPVTVLAAGEALAAGADGGQMLLTLPAGGRGQPAGPDGLAGLLASFPCWSVIGGTCDWLLVTDSASPGPAQPGTAGAGQRGAGSRQQLPGLDDGLLAVWPAPFAWLLLAEPITVDGLKAETIHVRSELTMSRLRDTPGEQIQTRRMDGRYSELRQASATGMWRVRLLAGGADERAAARVAGLVCASADLNGLPYALAPLAGGARLDQALSGGDVSTGMAIAEDPDPVPEAAFVASTALLAALARPPAREVPGVHFTLLPEFDVTPEIFADGAADPGQDGLGGVPAGLVLDRSRMPAGPLTLPTGSLNRHTFVCGATGAGKSQTVRGLLESATRLGIPWLVIEPAKAEYQLMAARLPDARVIRIAPGEPDTAPAGLNPLEPAAGPGGTRFPLQAHADLVRALFLAAFEAEEPFPQVLASALARCYDAAGWDLALGEPIAPGLVPAYPTLEDLQHTATQVVADIGYGQEVTDNVTGFIQVRLSSLRLGTTGRFLGGGHPISLAALMESNVVLQIENVGDDQDKAFLMGSMLIQLTEYLRMRHREQGPIPPRLRHLTVIEEAHRLLRAPVGRSGPAAHAVDMFAGLLAEVRAYGEGLVIAEQIPSKLIPDVIKNTAVKIVHRLPAADDRDAVGATMNITPAQSQYLVTLPPGEAAVFTDGMDFPLLARLPDGTARETQTPAVTAPATGLIGRRSSTCGQDCQGTPCTLRQMRAAQQALAAAPAIVLWAEYTVLGHLTGWHMPVPAAALRAQLDAMPARLRDCAVGHATDAAVSARIPAIAAKLSPAVLADHVATAIRAGLDERRWVCDREEPHWLAPAYQWAPVVEELRLAYQADPGAPRHPRSPQWESAHGRPIPGHTCALQLETAQAWLHDAVRDRAELEIIAFGARSPSAIETALGARRGDRDFDQRLARSLDYFTDCPWPLTYLATPSSEAGQVPT
jgi:DNA helicase HerA-like ATPase